MTARPDCCRGGGSGEMLGVGTMVACFRSLGMKRSLKQRRRMHRVSGFTPRHDMRLASSLKTTRMKKEGSASPPVEAKTSGEVKGRELPFFNGRVCVCVCRCSPTWESS